MNRFPMMIRSVNESLDEIITAIDKVNAIYQSAEQMSPMVKQVAKLLADAKAGNSGPVRTSEGRSRQGQVHTARAKKKKPSSTRGIRRVW
ncbi:hypothetical protein ACFQI7_23390 [Paenibacillus allorhizosphaerae]|uniref:Uncharacterized protein n=1 Tax=Paenibacillus allorhizosphaerae TaxID=2849866 RepID=A0ABM8VJX0_9BACL|nr:hypothetical protein [Paenibacillus allorhizosphaerae]CAG7646180.1 hypothetical protein PAECIP111802_03679 [Paenibacillus allorhizosphaerae]